MQFAYECYYVGMAMSEGYANDGVQRARDADCTFCDVLERPKTAFDVSQSFSEAGLVLMPALGMMVRGYFLAVSQQHITSFGQLNTEQLQRTDASLQRIEQRLQLFFGNYFRLEHGSDNITECGSGGCLDHAHIHLIPADDDVGVRVQDGLKWLQLDSYQDIKRYSGAPYIYLGRLGTHHIVPDPRLPGQWIRRQLAQVRGLRQWDWALKPGSYELLSTMVSLRQFPHGRVVFGLDTDAVSFEPRHNGQVLAADSVQWINESYSWTRGDT